MYSDDDLLLLSGIQHFVFCRRQWALIHVEGQWAENTRTMKGKIIHDRAHDEHIKESRVNRLVARGLRISSYTLGVVGKCDVVEFHRCASGVILHGRESTWQPYPIEYKKGKPKDNPADILQLCAESMCLEEMLCCNIPEGCLFYHDVHRRVPVIFDQNIRENVKHIILEMHQYMKKGYTPRVRPKIHCNACSLKSVCLPRNYKKWDVAQYYDSLLKEDK